MKILMPVRVEIEMGLPIGRNVPVDIRMYGTDKSVDGNQLMKTFGQFTVPVDAIGTINLRDFHVEVEVK